MPAPGTRSLSRHTPGAQSAVGISDLFGEQVGYFCGRPPIRMPMLWRPHAAQH